MEKNLRGMQSSTAYCCSSTGYRPFSIRILTVYIENHYYIFEGGA